jgi:hypothetical protein
MPAFDAADTRVSKRAHCASKGPIMISQDDARQGPSGHRMLYVLGFGLAGDPVEHARVHLFRYVLRVRLKARPHHSAALGAASPTRSPNQLHRVPLLRAFLVPN